MEAKTLLQGKCLLPRLSHNGGMKADRGHLPFSVGFWMPPSVSIENAPQSPALFSSVRDHCLVRFHFAGSSERLTGGVTHLSSGWKTSFPPCTFGSWQLMYFSSYFWRIAKAISTIWSSVYYMYILTIFWAKSRSCRFSSFHLWKLSSKTWTWPNWARSWTSFFKKQLIEF